MPFSVWCGQQALRGVDRVTISDRGVRDLSPQDQPNAQVLTAVQRLSRATLQPPLPLTVSVAGC
jgi:hypothetical protein